MGDKVALITGAAGFIGFHLAKHILESTGWQLFLLDDFSRSNKDKEFIEMLEDPRVIFLEGKISEFELPDSDVVFHLAAINGTERFYSRPWEVAESAGMSTHQILDRYRLTNSKIFVASSSEVYAGAEMAGIKQRFPTDERTPLVVSDLKNPRWSYAGGKIYSEILTMAAINQFSTDATIIRFNNIYGPRMGNEHFIPQFLKRLLSGDGTVFGGEQTRSFMYVDDAARVLVELASLAKSKDNCIIHVGSQDERKIIDVAHQIKRLVGSRCELRVEGAPPGSVNRRLPSTEKLLSLVPNADSVKFEDGLARTVSWYLFHKAGSDS